MLMICWRADNEDDACQVLREAKDVMAQAGMKLDK